MKKLAYILPVAALLLGACSHEENVELSNNGTYRITVKLPDNYTTRAIGDGSSATVLSYAIYDAGQNNAFVEQGTGSFDNNDTAIVDINLISGRSYNIAFFAQSAASMNTADAEEPSNAVYEFDGKNGTLTVNYSNMTSENNLADAYGCFYKLYPTGVITGNTASQPVVLTRPVAQLNYGTTATGTTSALEGVTTNLSSSKPVPNTLDLITGTVSGSTTLDLQGFSPLSSETFPIEGYEYLAMCYVLTGSEESAVYDFNLDIMKESAGDIFTNTIEVSAVPLQANYRTNVYGPLLSVNASFSISKDTDWGKPSHNQGEGIAEEPSKNDDGAYVMENQGNFLWLANEVNGGSSHAGDNFVMESDVYFTNPLTPIGIYISDNNMQPFAGNFDGNGFTLHNVEVTGSSSNYSTGVFGCCFNVDYQTITGVNIENISVSGITNNVGGLIGYAGRCYISNINITGNVAINGTQHNVGGVVGYMFAGTLSNIHINASEGSYVMSNNPAANNAGGIVGGTGYGITEMSDLTSSLNVTGGGFVGGIAGVVYPERFTSPATYTVKIENCSSTGDLTATGFNPYNRYYIGGIAGSWFNADGQSVYFIGCDYDGKLSTSEPVADGYNLADTNKITGAGFNSSNVGNLYIMENAGSAETNVASEHLLPGVN